VKIERTEHVTYRLTLPRLPGQPDAIRELTISGGVRQEEAQAMQDALDALAEREAGKPSPNG
jgi:hypothetical protein